jgi:[acyl-carrier-protein] S-malonyltransferase
MKTIVLFSGQGSQYVGMAKKILLKSPGNNKINDMFKMASDVFKRDLLDMCLNGPKDELDKTINCQAAVFVTSLANIEAAQETHPYMVTECVATAGFSVGEYAALVFAGALKFENG